MINVNIFDQLNYRLDVINQAKVGPETTEQRLGSQQRLTNATNSFTSLYSASEAQGLLNQAERVRYQKENSLLLSMEGLAAFGTIDNILGSTARIGGELVAQSAKQSVNQIKSALKEAIARGWDGRMDNYRYHQSSGTFIGPNGGRIIPTGGFDLLGNPVFRRISPDGSAGAFITISFNENGQAVQGRVIRSHSIDNQPVTSELHRPYLRTKTQEVIFNGYKRLENGDYEDVYGNIIRFPIDIGHIPGYEHRRLVLAANQKGMTQQQFNDFVNSHPEYFRLENRKINRGHSSEKPGVNEIESIIEDMNKFFKEGK